MRQVNQGLKLTKKKAVEYYKQACEKGSSDAMLIYGRKLLKGQEIPPDKEEADKVYKKFADDRKNMKAMNNYGIMLLLGDGIPSDKKMAAVYLKDAADLGNPKAMLSYGKMLYDGNGINVFFFFFSLLLI